jgi:hypothetical protein
MRSDVGWSRTAQDSAESDAPSVPLLEPQRGVSVGQLLFVLATPFVVALLAVLASATLYLYGGIKLYPLAVAVLVVGVFVLPPASLYVMRRVFRR